MAEEAGFGVVCGACRAFSPRGTETCPSCGVGLTVGQPASAAQAPPASSSEPARKPSIDQSGGFFDGVNVLELGEDVPESADGAASTAAEAATDAAGETPEGRVCPACSATVPGDHQFCGRCGGALETTPPPSEGPEPRRVTEGTGAGGPATEAFHGFSPRSGNRPRLIAVHGEGADGATYTLASDQEVCGRTTGQVRLPDDEYISPRHASFHNRGGQLFVRDEESANGVFLRISAPVRLEHGDLLLIGEQLLRFEVVRPMEELPDGEGTYFLGSRTSEGSFRLAQIFPGGRQALVYVARNPAVVVGREGCDLNFPADRFMSRAHARVEATEGAYLLTDTQSRNGTYIRIKQDQELHQGDHVFLGQQLLRVEL